MWFDHKLKDRMLEIEVFQMYFDLTKDAFILTFFLKYIYMMRNVFLCLFYINYDITF